MFKFGSSEDKRRISVGGPWHFDRALIVLTVPSGIGDIKKQDFSRVSFWVQLHEVPLICMEKETSVELETAIGKVEEVETNSSGECIGKFLRMRISVDITKLLKKVVVLEPMEKEVDDGTVVKQKIFQCWCIMKGFQISVSVVGVMVISTGSASIINLNPKLS